MKKIGAIVLNWNGQTFIYPFMKMLHQGGVDKIVMIQGSRPWSDYEKEYGLSNNPDHSEQIVRDHFPDVEIYPATFDEFGAHLYNQGLKHFEGFDLVLRLDYDMFLTKEDWDKFMAILHDDNFQYNNARLDFARNTTNYYYDFDHGCTNAREFDPIAVSPKHEFSGILDYPDDNMVILSKYDGHDFMVHHFRGWKGFGIEDDWIKNLKPNHHGVYADSLLQYNPEKKWLRCPQEIRDMFREADWILNNYRDE